ncbi:MAG: thiamine-phosphate kinase [Brachymonas sp.]
MSVLGKSWGEFDLIARHFRRDVPLRHAALGVGDDCALLRPIAGEMLAISTDTLVAGRHFFEDADPAAIGHKALAVNLSDLAACGAQPMAFVLALTLPDMDDAWLAAFAQGLFAMADASGCELIGGDTTRGPLAITITVFGSVPLEHALSRSGARSGDDIYVSHGAGVGLGDARLALHLLQAQRGQPAADAFKGVAATQRAALLQTCRQRLERPAPRTALGLALRSVASACMDLSDGLQGDLRHILAASEVGATLDAGESADGAGLLEATSPALRTLGVDAALAYVLAGGDDYELLFTAAAQQRVQVSRVAAQTGLLLTRIGCIDAQAGLRLRHADGSCTPIEGHGFDHFVS